MKCTIVKELLQTALKYSPVNPLVYIISSEPILWAISLAIVLIRGDCFFEIEDMRETEADDNLYVDIEGLYTMLNAQPPSCNPR